MAQEGAELYGDIPTRRFFGEIAKLEAQNRESYSPEDFGYFDRMNIALKEEFQAFLSTFDTSNPLLAVDFGSGLGVHARYAAKYFNTTVHALDYSESLTEASRRINKLCNMEDKV